MSKEVLKKVSAEISNDCWKKLKILSIKKEITLQELIKDILDRSANRNNLLETEEVK